MKKYLPYAALAAALIIGAKFSTTIRAQLAKLPVVGKYLA